ncbi:MAG: hypothetical protein ACI83D_000142 [Planctomycetota bacterium]|jgi:hypothetical protein
MSIKSSFIWIISLIIAALLVWLIVAGSIKANKPYIAFAQCLEEKGATFYGAWWCPHCVAQKGDFKGAKNHIPYVECSTPQKDQTEACKTAEIASYPTWEFADGTRVSGAQTLATLASNTGCPLPGDLLTEASTETEGAATLTPTTEEVLPSAELPVDETR